MTGHWIYLALAAIALVAPAQAELPPATLNFQQSKVPPAQPRMYGKNARKGSGAAPAKPALFFRTSTGRQIEGQLEPCLRSGSGAPLRPEVMLALCRGFKSAESDENVRWMDRWRARVCNGARFSTGIHP